MDQAPEPVPEDRVIHWTAGCFIVGLLGVLLVVLVASFVVWRYERAG